MNLAKTLEELSKQINLPIPGEVQASVGNYDCALR